MNTLNRKVNIPKFLQELHGKQTRRIDLLLTYFSAILCTALVWWMVRDLSISLFKMVILCFLTFDISGGVIANFTDGTQAYFSGLKGLRYKFIALHLLQPAFLMWLFPNDIIYISIISVFTLVAITILNGIKNGTDQRIWASFFALFGIALSFVFNEIEPVVHFLMVLYIVKLVIAFSIQWNS